MRRPLFLASAVMIGVAACALAAPASAQDSERRKVEVAPYLGIDQVVVAPIKGGGDVLTYTNVTAGVTASIQTRRMEAAADLQYAHSFGWGDEVSDQDIISGIVSGQYSVARGLTLNAGALATRVRTDGLSGASVRNDGYSSQVYAGYVGPAYATRLGDLDINASYRLSYARVEDDVNADFPGARGSGFGDSVAHDLMGSVGVAPGVWMPFGLVASAGYTREDASQLDQRFEDKWGRIDATLPVSPTVALIGGAGYEKIRISQRSPLLDSNGAPVISSRGRYVTDESSPRALLYDFDDIIWDVGVLWRPSRRTSLTARVGERYGGMTYSGSFVWQGRSQSFALVVFDGIDSFGRIITSDVAALSGSNLNLVRNPFSGDFTGCAFSNTGGGQCFNDALSGITGANFRYRGVGAQYAAERGPWGLGIGLGYSQRKFVTPSGDTVLVRGTRDQNWYGTASLSYKVDSRSNIDTAVYANYFDASGNRLDVLNLGAFTSYYRVVTRNLQASASVGVDSAKADDLDAIINAMGQVGLRYIF